MRGISGIKQNTERSAYTITYEGLGRGSGERLGLLSRSLSSFSMKMKETSTWSRIILPSDETSRKASFKSGGGD